MSENEEVSMYEAARTGKLELLIKFLSVRTEDIKQLEASLEDNYLVNKQDNYGRTILHYGVLNNHETVVNQLVLKEVHIPLEPGEAAIMSNSFPGDDSYHIYTGVYAVVRKLKIDINIKDIDGYTPLGLAVFYDHRKIVYNLITFMVKEIEELFVTPEDHIDYDSNQDEYISITLEYQQEVMQSFIKNCRESLTYACGDIKQLLADAIIYFEKQQKLFEENAKKPSYASRMSKGVVPKKETIFLKEC